MDNKYYGPLYGDIFYSAYHGTLLAVFTDAYIDGTFYISYSKSGTIVGPWSEPSIFYQTPNPSSNFNYAGHAYPGFDLSGKTLLLSYTFGGLWTRFVRVTWG